MGAIMIRVTPIRLGGIVSVDIRRLNKKGKPTKRGITMSYEEYEKLPKHVPEEEIILGTNGVGFLSSQYNQRELIEIQEGLEEVDQKIFPR